MRGDSLRDLYAKTLALLGLGVLAGTGALVDYWPAGVTLPAVDAGLAPPEMARSLPVPDRLPNLELAPAPVIAVASRPVDSARPLVTVAAVEPAPIDVVDVHEEPAPRIPRLQLARVDGIVLLDATMAEPPVPAVPALSFSVDYALGEEVPLTAPAEWPLATMAMAPTAASGEDEDDGLFSGMVRVTGHTIVRGGRKTGASIVEAFRVVSNAVRRALPN